MTGSHTAVLVVSQCDPALSLSVIFEASFAASIDSALCIAT